MSCEWLLDNPFVPPMNVPRFAKWSCWSDVVVPRDREQVRTRIRRLLAGERSADQVRAVTAEGRTEDLYLLGVPSSENGVQRILGSATIVDRRRADPDLATNEQAHHIAALEAQIRAREEQLRTAFEDIGYVSDMLRRYRLMVSEHRHRSKNNVQLAMSLVQTLKRKPAGLTPEQLAAIDRLGAMAKTDALLIQDDHEQFEPADPFLSEIAEQTVRVRAGDLVALDCDIQPLVLCGVELRTLGMVLHELITNAIKHAVPAGAKTIKVRLLRHDDDTAELRVLDDGIGIGAGQGAQPASGIGIITDLVRHMEGELSIRPLGPKGTLVSLVFRHRAKLPATASGQFSDTLPR